MSRCHSAMKASEHVLAVPTVKLLGIWFVMNFFAAATLLRLAKGLV